MNLEILNALRIIVNHLEDEDIRWTIVGSTSLALQGVDITPNDIDILTDEYGAFKIGALLKEFEIKPVSFSQTDLFESFYGIYDIGGTKVDVMGDFRVMLEDTWVSLSDRLESPSLVQVDTMNIPVSSMHDQLLFYEKLGREKDKDCILEIKKVLRIF